MRKPNPRRGRPLRGANAPKEPSYEALRHALDNTQWKETKRLLWHVPTSVSPHATGQELAAAVDAVRITADILVEACSFRTAFEKSFATRRALLKMGVCDWGMKTLIAFATFSSVVTRISMMFEVLGLGADERSHVGCAGAVDELTKLWHRNQKCVEIVSALASLCSGHIDNISRVMRQRGLKVAIEILTDPTSVDSPKLLQQTFLLTGLCAICTPDIPAEAEMLVPALSTALIYLKGKQLPDVTAIGICAFGSIGDCWLKESTGYEIADPYKLVDTLLGAWSSHSKSFQMASAASWAFHALMSAHEIIREIALEGPRAKALYSLAGEFERKSATISALRLQVASHKGDGNDDEDAQHQTFSVCAGLKDGKEITRSGDISNAHESTAALQQSPVRRSSRVRKAVQRKEGDSFPRKKRHKRIVPDSSSDSDGVATAEDAGSVSGDSWTSPPMSVTPEQEFEIIDLTLNADNLSGEDSMYSPTSVREVRGTRPSIKRRGRKNNYTQERP